MQLEAEDVSKQLAPRHGEDILLDFVRDRDVDCPRCGYNLRNLSKPVCPECRETLSLFVGVQKIHLIWLLLTLAPGAFCGVALALITSVAVIFGPPPGAPPAPIIFALCFMCLSAMFTLVLALRFRRFLQRALPAQCVWAVATWGCNIGAFGLFILWT